MRRYLEATPCSQLEFSLARHTDKIAPPAPWERAAQFFICNRQSRQGLGRDFATLARSRTRRGMNELPSAWLSAIEGLPEVHARLKRVVILNIDGAACIRQQDGPRTLFYCDPPYIHSTRSNGGEYGAHEMTDVQHRELLETLAGIKGRFLLSGYGSGLYHEFAQEHGWSCDQIEIDNKASSAKVKEKKTECIWRNYV
jgi:DNA adenine methylase